MFLYLMYALKPEFNQDETVFFVSYGLKVIKPTQTLIQPSSNCKSYILLYTFVVDFYTFYVGLAQDL